MVFHQYVHDGGVANATSVGMINCNKYIDAASHPYEFAYVVSYSAYSENFDCKFHKRDHFAYKYSIRRYIGI